MSEASLRQPWKRFHCVFRDTSLDSDDAPSLKLSPSGAGPFSQRAMERSALASSCLGPRYAPNDLPRKETPHVNHR
jgi:hypothetical protein